MQQVEKPRAARPVPSWWRIALAAVPLVLAAVAVVLVFRMTNFRGLSGGVAGLAWTFRGDWHFPVWTLICLVRAAQVMMTCFGVGWLMLRARGWRGVLHSPVDRVLYAAPVGAALISLGVLGVGLVSVSSVTLSALGVLAAAIGLAGAVQAWGDVRIASRGLRTGLREAMRSPLIATCVVLAGAVLVIALVYAAAPSTQSDALRYHLAALFTWKRDGRIHYLPHQAFSNFPMLAEMLYLLAMPMASPMQTGAARLIHLGFLCIALGLIARMARRLGGRRTGWIAAAGFALIPCVPVLAGWAFVDLFTVVYFLAFVDLAGLALARPRRGSGTLMGLVVGAGCAVKYSMVPLLGGLGCVWLAMMAARPAGRRGLARLVGGVALGAVVFAGPWYLRNAAWTGNPVYPLAWSAFHGGDWSAQNAAFYAAKAHEKGYVAAARMRGVVPAWSRGPAGRLLELAFTPWTTVVAFDRFESHPIGLLPPVMLALALGGAVAGRRRRGGVAASWIALAAGGSWVFWFFTYQSNRMLLPTLALVCVLGTAGWERLRGAGGALAALARAAGCGLLGAAMIYGCLFTLYIFGDAPAPGLGNPGALATALGFEPRDLYLRRNLDYYPAAQSLGRLARKGEGALLVGEHRTLYFDLPLVASDWFDTPQPLPLIRATPNNDALLDALTARGVRYIFFNAGQLALYRDAYFRPRFTPAEYARFERLWTNPRLKLVERFATAPGGPGILIYRIEPRGAN